MIGTVTLNTAADKRYIMNRSSMGGVDRVKECRYTAGGGGINVSRVAKLAGENIMATDFASGHAGDCIMQGTQCQGITPFLAHTEGESRPCINLFDYETHRQAELLEPGEFVTDEERKRLLDHVDTMASQCDVITVSRSTPKGVSPKLYSDIIGVAEKGGKKVLLDTSGEMLGQSLKSGPYLIKSNGDEIKSLTGISLETGRQVIHEAKRLRRMKIEIVVVSLRANDSMVVCNERVYRVRVPTVKSVNAVGCGGFMMAGLAMGIARGYGMKHLIWYASTVSVANALQGQTGSIDMSDVERLIPGVDIELLGTW